MRRMFVRVPLFVAAVSLACGCMEESREGFSLADHYSVEVYPTQYQDYYDAYITDLDDEQYLSLENLAWRMQMDAVQEYATYVKIPMDFKGLFFVLFRGFGRDTDTHPLRPCVYEPVTHVHIIVKASRGTPDDLAWAKIHVGRYQNAATGEECAVIFDSQNPEVCIPMCSSDWIAFARELVSVIDSSIAAAVTVSAALVAAAATILQYLALAAIPLAL